MSVAVASTSETMCVERMTIAFAREFGEQIAKADALFGVEAGGGLIDDEQLRVVEQGLRDADALLHASRESAQRAFADIVQIDEIEQLVDAATLRGGVESFDCGQVFKKFDGDSGSDRRRNPAAGSPSTAADCVGLMCQVRVIPQNAALGCARDGGEDAHERGLAGAVRTEQAEHAGPQLKTEVTQRPNIAAILLAHALDAQLQWVFLRVPFSRSIICFSRLVFASQD